MNYRLFSLVFGFSVWLMATLAFHFWGHTFFLIDNPLLLSTFFLGTAPLLWLLAQWVFNYLGLEGSQRLESAVLMAVPGMISDVFCLKFSAIVFPTLTNEQAIVLGAWILWAYVIVLLIGVVKSRQRQRGGM